MTGSVRARVVAAVLAGAVFVPAQASAQTLTDGHADYAVRLVDGQLRSEIKDGTQGTAVWRPVSAVRFGVADAARTSVPVSAAWLGAPGEATWMLPQTQRAGVLWVGWNTEALTGAMVDGPVVWRLDAVDGPGAVTVFQTGVFGEPDIVFASADGLPDARLLPLGVHAHGNWAFAREGSYRLTFTMSARTHGGAVVQDTQTLAVAVGSAAINGPAPTPAPAPGSADTPPAAPDAPQPGGSTPDATARSAAPTLRPLSARLRGRTLQLRLRVDRRSRVDVTVRRGKRVSGRARPRSVAAGTRTLEFQLDRRVRAGRHRVRVTARADGRSTTRTLPLRVR